jgi:hypothetical protein
MMLVPPVNQLKNLLKIPMSKFRLIILGCREAVVELTSVIWMIVLAELLRVLWRTTFGVR